MREGEAGAKASEINESDCKEMSSPRNVTVKEGLKRRSKEVEVKVREIEGKKNQTVMEREGIVRRHDQGNTHRKGKYKGMMKIGQVKGL